MRQSQLPIWGLLLALFFGVRTGIPSSHSPSSQASNASVTKEGSSSKHAGPVTPPGTAAIWQDALCKLNPDYGSTRYMVAQRKTTSPDQDPPCLSADVLKTFKLHAMIATVPDPIHTHLGLSFDRTIDAVQAAAAEVSFFPYLHALPWPPPHSEQADSQSEAASQYEYPGILLFRKGNNNPDSARNPDSREEFLAVLLVPELPSSGIDQRTFLSAVHIIHKIAPDSAKPLFLLGPNFSGSVPLLTNLKNAMNSQLAEDNRREHQTNPSQPGACIKAISGSVTNALDPFTEPEVDDCKSSFRTLQTADREALNLLIAGLRTSNGYCPGDVAILSEEGTEYGNLTEFKDGGSEPSVSEPCGARDKALYLHFPREISKLRNASIAVLTAQGAKDNASAAKTDVLPLNWQDAHPFVKDDVRNYGEQTAVSEETVLASLATLIRSQRIKTMGIFATDPLDTAFLIHSFRQSTPDVRLFIRDPDLLYLRTPDVGSLNGILAINNFPLIPQNQVWTQPADDGRHHVVMFPSSAQEAEYSAFITLARQKLRREPLPEPYLLDAGWPKAAPADNPKSQPLWIGVTGTAGYYPIRFLNQDASTHDRAFLHSLDVGRPPYACILAMLVIGFIGLLHATWAAFPGTAASWFKTDFDISDRFDALSVAKGLCHAIALLSLCLCVSLIASSFLFFHSTGYRVIVGQYRISVYRLGAAFGIIVVLVLLLAAAWRLCDSVIIPALTRNASFLHNDVLSARKTALTIPFALAVFVAPIVLWIVNTSAATFDNAFMHYRDLYLGSGVAPALPALLLAVIAYIGVLTYLRRVSDWEYGSVRTPPMQLDELFSGDFTASLRCIDQWMLGIPAASARRVGLFTAFFVMSIFSLRPWAIMDTLESQWVHWFLVAGFTFGLFLMSINWIRFIAIWRQLRQLLRGLEKLPLRQAFSRLPRESSLPIWSWSVHNGTFLPVVQAAETLRGLVRADPTLLNRDTARRLWLGMRALENPNQHEKLPQNEEKEKPREEEAHDFISRVQQRDSESEPHLAVDETATMSGAVTADGTIPIPLRGKGRTPATTQEIRPAASPEKTDTAAPSSKRRKELMRQARDAMTATIVELSSVLVHEYWNRGRVGVQSDTSAVPASDLKYVLAEDLVALRFYSYIRYVVSQLRSLLFFLALAFSALFLALHVYSFRADQSIDWSFTVLLLIMGVGIVWVLLQMERDPLLSRLEGTNANQLSKNFFFSLIKYGLVPLATVVGSQIPSVSNFLLTKLQPALEAFR